MKMAKQGLSFDALRGANKARLPQFKNKLGVLAHTKIDGSDWTPAQWLQAVVGELGEYANIRKKFERGDITFEQFEKEAAKELADVQTYLDILAMRCLDTKVPVNFSNDTFQNVPHPTGIDLGKATIEKFNEISERAGSDVYLCGDGWAYR